MKSGSSRVGLPLFILWRLGRGIWRAWLLLVVLGLVLIAVVAHDRKTSPGIKTIAHYTSSIDGDIKAVQAMRDRGDDLARPVSIEFYFYVASRHANTLASDLLRIGYRCEIDGQPAGARYPGETLVLASTTHRVSVEYLQQSEKRFDVILERDGGGDYDGWEVTEPKPSASGATPNLPRG